MATAPGSYPTVSNNTTVHTNSTDNFTATPEIMQEIPSLKGIYIFLYCIIFLLGVTGNSLVVYVVLRNKSMQTITNIFITNLAASDILMSLLSVPFTPLAYFMGAWNFGETLCHIVPMIQCISVYVSTLTSTAIAIDRYFVIVYPFKPRMKLLVCLMLIVAVWIISISISLPLGIYQEVHTNDNHEAYCRERWPRRQSRQFFTVTSLVLQYIVPCCIITFCYSKVSRVLRKRSRAKIGSGSKSREKDEMEIKRKRRTNKMLIAMVAIFMCCWLPLNIVLLVTDYQEAVIKWYYYTLFFFTAHVIAMSSIIYNPFLYAWMNDNFKKEFKQILPFLFPRGRESNVNGSYTQYTNVETQQSVVNKSPQKEKNGNDNVKTTKAYFQADSEKVHLKIDEEERNSDS